LESLSGYTQMTNTRVPESVWRSASGLFNERVDGSGWSLSPEEDRLFSSRSRQTSKEGKTETVKGHWILLVEDNAADVSLIRHALKESGVAHRVVVVTDGDRASRLIDEHDVEHDVSPALIILDLNVPRKDGREILARVKLSPGYRNAPVVVLSSSQAEADRQDVLSLGADRYITKPSDLDEFLSIGAVFRALIEGRGRAI